MNDSDPQAIDPMDEQRAEREALEHARAFLHANLEASLLLDGEFNENIKRVPFVLDHETGKLIASVPVATFHASEVIFRVPEEADDAMGLLVTAEEVEESGATDRWMAFHGEPDHVRWAACWIDGAKHGPWVFDGDAMMQPNPLAPIEPRVCKQLNSDEHRAMLAGIARTRAGAEIAKPLCVGVCPHGVWLRAPFGVTLARFDEPITEPDADRVINALR